jgi:hypothetical protein
MNRMMNDLAIDRANHPDSTLHDTWDSDDEEDDGGEMNIIDKSS